MSEIAILNGSKNLIICFGGMALKMGGIVPFEFLTYLSNEYSGKIDLLFYVDKHQYCYHKGIESITNNIDETVVYLNKKINEGNYEKVIFMGTSAGGYASVLFGSLCKVTNVIAFIPPTILKNPKYNEYTNLRNIINDTTHYLLYGDLNIKNINDPHHISNCENIEHFQNITVIKRVGIEVKKLRDTGEIKRIIDNIIH